MARIRTDALQIPETLVVGVDDRGMSDHAVRAAVDLGARLGANVELLHAVRVPILEWMGSDVTKGPAALGQALENAEPAINEHVRQLLDTGRASDLYSTSPAHSVGLPSRDETDAPASRAFGAAFGSMTSDVGDFPRASDFDSRSATSNVASPTLTSDLHVRVVPGTPTEVLLAAAQHANSAVIFLGQHEKRGLVDFGSTARAVLARGTVPVWIQTRPEQPVQRILVAVDLSQDSLRALAFACRLAGPLGATIRAVHVFDARALYASLTPDPLGYTPPISVADVRDKLADDFERAMEAFDWRGVDHSVELREGKAEEAILELAGSSDLVVLGTHGRTGLALGVLGGVAHTVLKQSEAPVLAVPFPSRRFRI
jgi:nucleotide-binding universal stress UspA family protein